ncbi:MAG TPA: sodium:solute symporter [Tepidisphaeraceae bacterium]|jgi:SSS family transporter
MRLLVDGLIILLYFIVIITIGLSMGRRENTLHDFALGGRCVPWWAVMASIVAAETSAATFLGVPSEGFKTQSLAYMQLAYGVILGRIVVAYVFLKPFYHYRVYTVYDFLGIRFGPKTKGYASALFLFMRTLASGTRLFVPSLVMVLAWKLLVGGEASAAVGQQLSVQAYLVAIVLLTIVTCLYTAIGGIKAVIWTDLIQAALMIGAALVAIATLLYHLGGDSWNLAHGMRAVMEAAPNMASAGGYVSTGLEPRAVEAYRAEHHLAAMGAWDYVKMWMGTDYTLPAAVGAYTVMCIGAFGTDQDMVQRMLTATDYKKSRRSVITAAFLDLPIFAGFAFIGVLLFAYYQNRANPPAAADVFASYILHVMPVGVRGLVLAGVFATAMGSLSAALNALATSATNDWYIPYFRRSRPRPHGSESAGAGDRSDAHDVTVARIFTAVFAVLMILIAWAFAHAKVTNPNVRIIPVVLGIAGFILGPMLGVFLLGMLTKTRGSDRGNMIAMTVGLLTTIYLGGLHVDLANLLGVASPIQAPPFKIAFTWFALIGATVVVVIGIFFRTPGGRVAAAAGEVQSE